VIIAALNVSATSPFFMPSVFMDATLRPTVLSPSVSHELHGVDGGFSDMPTTPPNQLGCSLEAKMQASGVRGSHFVGTP
jgi:hypothetical protein